MKPARMRGAAVATLLCCLGICTSAGASSRYALLFAANQGDPGETPLRFAARDAKRLRDVLVSIGGLLAENVVVLEEPSADRVRDALARLNARIRAEQQDRHQVSRMLLVFYSGHADALSLHLGGTKLPWEELRNLTAGSSASTRLLIVDACRSGQATRVKGTKLDRPFAIPYQANVPEGFAILSSATAGESAQESDEIGGSFFTHHLLAALQGVADSNADGKITLAEAYQYASDRTVASTAATVSGIQHPTYAYDLKGRSDLVLTEPGEAQRLAAFHLTQPGQYLLREDGPQGPLVLEANIAKEPRTVRMRPGRYFLQLRVPERYYEGTVVLSAGVVKSTGQTPLRSVEYAQLVRKGGAARRASSSTVFVGLATPLLGGLSPPWGPSVMFSMDLAALTLDAEAAYWRSTAVRPAIHTATSALGFGLGARKVFDVHVFALSAGLRLGGAYVDQRYDTDRIAPARWRLVPHLETIARADLPLPWGLFVAAEGGLRVSHIRQQVGLSGVESRPPVQGRGQVGIGAFW